MRTAIISDIHANLEAFTAVLDDIGSQDVDDIVCLGDIVGYGASPNECVDVANSHCSMILMGNHDAAALGNLSTENFNVNAKSAIEWTENALTKRTKDVLHGLPLARTCGENTYVHATPYEPQMWYYITSMEEAAFNFQFFQTRFCFVGHTHIPMIISMAEKQRIDIHAGASVRFDESDDTRFLINVGSVGQPRDRNQQSCYGLLDISAARFSLRRVAYDIKACQKRMREAKMPEFLLQRLEQGR